jgi:hypothetical protein
MVDLTGNMRSFSTFTTARLSTEWERLNHRRHRLHHHDGRGG